ncbi:MAG: hypothetical protein ABII27_00865 [bacterium]
MEIKCDNTQLTNKTAEMIKTFSVDVEHVNVEEKMTFEVDNPENDIIHKVLNLETSAKSKNLDISHLRAKHYLNKELSSVKVSYLEAGFNEEPTEDYVYKYMVDEPLQYEGWELNIINSRGEDVWISGGSAHPPNIIVWNGYNEQGEWIAHIGDNYTMILKARDKKTNKINIIEKPFTISSYIINTNDYIIINILTKTIFDDNGLDMTDKGKKILDKICFKIKTAQYQRGNIGLKTTNASLANVQMKKIMSYAEGVKVNIKKFDTKITEISQIPDNFEILLKKP